ncbi:MAG: hypothetical protein U9R42_09465 [Bacteroidota bacterium]|nr:hypothetical protein [Bacteroidota bacterium]
MIEINIPGVKNIEIKYLVLDYNGTIGIDGDLIHRVPETLELLAEKIEIFIITANTFGNARERLKNINCDLRIISEQNQAYTKKQFVKQLGSKNTFSIGNGNNDSMMLSESALSVAVIQKEGCSVAALTSADIVMTNIVDALELLNNPLRIKATLRV